MSLIKKPVNGMKDILPEEMALREHLMHVIKEEYASFGFCAMETPAMEHIENLLSKQGGDNEKLIFKVLKRGEKLKLEEAALEADLTDAGLRYDLTLPLARYYANNAANLPSPFKALQIGSVWRADRPQKGRFRQFTQCDIDVLGEESNLAEIELILATTQALAKLCPKHKFTVRINDRRMLRAMTAYAGIAEEMMEKVLITLDKMDKIGTDGVLRELLESGLAEESVQQYMDLFSFSSDGVCSEEKSIEVVKEFQEKISSMEADAAAENLITIIEAVIGARAAEFSISFDPTLVRGMGYYTGTIFEVSMEGFSGSVAGGGRYDRMIGRFTGKDTAACGFSIGFERIITILQDEGCMIEGSAKKKAFLYEKGIENSKLLDILKTAASERAQGAIILVSKMNKNKKFQKEQLMREGYEEFVEFYREGLR